MSRWNRRNAVKCPLCGASGVVLHRQVRDRLYAVPGTWDVLRCTRGRACGLLWLRPMPTHLRDLYPSDYYTHGAAAGKEPPGQRFDPWGGVMRRYERLRYEGGASVFDRLGALLALHPPRRAEVDAAYMHLRVRPGARLLDVGCGAGELLQRLSPLGWRPEGVEIDPAAVARARSIGAVVHEGAFEDLGFPENAYDAVTMNHVVEHVADPVTLVREAYRVLRPGGTLVIVTPNATGLGHRLFGRDWFPLETPRHLYLFTIRSLRSLVTRAGFTRIRARSTIRFANYFMILSRDIRVHGTTRMALSRAPFPRRTWARALQLAEWIARPVDRGIGDEIALTARKPPE